MLTFVAIVVGALVVIGVIILAINSGRASGRNDTATQATINKQHQAGARAENKRGGGLD